VVRRGFNGPARFRHQHLSDATDLEDEDRENQREEDPLHVLRLYHDGDAAPRGLYYCEMRVGRMLRAAVIVVATATPALAGQHQHSGHMALASACSS